MIRTLVTHYHAEIIDTVSSPFLLPTNLSPSLREEQIKATEKSETTFFHPVVGNNNNISLIQLETASTPRNQLSLPQDFLSWVGEWPPQFCCERDDVSVTNYCPSKLCFWCNESSGESVTSKHLAAYSHNSSSRTSAFAVIKKQTGIWRLISILEKEDFES